MIGTLLFAPTSHHQPRLWFEGTIIVHCSCFLSFFLEDEDDEEMVEPKIGHDSELENGDKKQEVKEGMVWEKHCVVKGL